VLDLHTEEAAIKQRWCKKAESEEVSEEQAADFVVKADAAAKITAELKNIFDNSNMPGCNHLEIDSTRSSMEKVLTCLRTQFRPQVVLVNHEKRLGIDTTCSNLAIKYNMIYISAYQLIKQHITQKTDWGMKLLAVQRTKDISLAT